MQRLFIQNNKRLDGFSYLHRKACHTDNKPDHKNTRQATLVFAHATGFNSYTYRQLFEIIDPGIDIYALDQRGHGLTTARAEAHELNSWGIYENDLSAFIDWLDRPVILAGHSLGGAVSAKVAALSPHKVKGLILVEPVLMPPFTDPLMSMMRTFDLGHLIPLVNSAKNRRNNFASFNAAVANYLNKGAFKTWPRSWIEDYVNGGTLANTEGEIVLSCKPEWEAKTFAVSGNKPWSGIKKLNCPITVIKGKTGSTLHPLALARLRKLHPDLDYTLISEASHFVPMEYPDKVAEIISHACLGNLPSREPSSSFNDLMNKHS